MPARGSLTFDETPADRRHAFTGQRPLTTQSRDETADPLRRGLLSLTVKIGLIILVFALLPVILYGRFKDADEDRQGLLIDGLQQQGQLLARALEPALQGIDARGTAQLTDTLERLTNDQIRAKLLLRPSGLDGTMFYVASAPTVSPQYLDEERAVLEQTGVLPSVDESCEGGRPLALRFVNPAGDEEFLTSLTPVITPAGCWLVITSQADGEAGEIAVNRVFADSDEVRIALILYAGMGLVTVMIGASIIVSLRRFARLARDISVPERHAGSFAEANRVPELAAVARDFDGMVRRLEESREGVRAMVRETALAFEPPLSAISRSVDPIRRALRPDDQRARRALETIRAAECRMRALMAASTEMADGEAPRERPDTADKGLSGLTSRHWSGNWCTIGWNRKPAGDPRKPARSSRVTGWAAHPHGRCRSSRDDAKSTCARRGCGPARSCRRRHGGRGAIAYQRRMRRRRRNSGYRIGSASRGWRRPRPGTALCASRVDGCAGHWTFRERTLS